MLVKNGKIFYTPDELGYHDRGKLKWMGMMLSDHTEALKKLKTDEEVFHQADVPKQLDDQTISHLLYKSFTYQKPIYIQANSIIGGMYGKHIPYIVLGYKDDFIYLQTIDGQERKCHLEDIRHIKTMDPAQWYKKQPLSFYSS